ncbi:D-alanyl-D-alanine carboxypeptidase family protein [Candidatus Parcubacteria bacterium]|nr:D-alanyl-D-alanine carboxypeptidase family protein [Candidatus Parcubacteria bacterium]
MNKYITLQFLGPVVGILALVLLTSVAYGYVQITALQGKVAVLESTLASTSSLLVGTLEETKSNLSQSLLEEKAALENKLGDISGTVDTLEKLSKTDPELLQKYSKVFFLNEHYAPERLEEIEPAFTYDEKRVEKIASPVRPFLEDLLNNAQDDNIDLFIKSAYRSFAEQQALKSSYKVVYGAGTANSFSADQGYSEHQLGTAVDFISKGQGGVLDGFDKTEAYVWLKDNAYKYGFIISYPKNNGYYIYEPWHWRFVGVKLATYLHKQNKNFYDLDQRTIDGYLVNIFDR